MRGAAISLAAERRFSLSDTSSGASGTLRTEVTPCASHSL
jgi:hypothetical protein